MTLILNGGLEISFEDYIPTSSFYIVYENKDITVQGIYECSFKIDRLSASYKVWVDVMEANYFVPQGMVSGAIRMQPFDVDIQAIIVIDFLNFNCRIFHIVYDHLRHSYLVSLEILMEKRRIEKFLHSRDKMSGGICIGRFDVLDLE